MVRFDGLTAEGEAKAHAGSIDPSLLEREKQLADIPIREAAALVLDLDDHAFGVGTNAEHTGGSVARRRVGPETQARRAGRSQRRWAMEPIVCRPLPCTA